MGCGCGGKKLEQDAAAAQQQPSAGLAGPANPKFTWPPRRGNGPAPKAA